MPSVTASEGKPKLTMSEAIERAGERGEDKYDRQSEADRRARFGKARKQDVADREDGRHRDVDLADDDDHHHPCGQQADDGDGLLQRIGDLVRLQVERRERRRPSDRSDDQQQSVSSQW